MAEINGTSVLLLVNTGTVAVPVYTVVGSQSNVNFTESTDPIDVSSKDSRSRKLLAGGYSASVSLDGFYVPSQAQHAALNAAMRDGASIVIRRSTAGVSVEGASAIVTNMSEDFPREGAGTISVSLEITGDWSAV